MEPTESQFPANPVKNVTIKHQRVIRHEPSGSEIAMTLGKHIVHSGSDSASVSEPATLSGRGTAKHLIPMLNAVKRVAKFQGN